MKRGTAAIRQYSLAFLLLTAMSAAIAAAQQGGPVRLTQPPPLAPNVEAFPRIAAPADRAAQRINQALARGDALVREWAESCPAWPGAKSSWTRTVSVTMAGPRYLSITAKDYWDCKGTAHPGVRLLAFVYDLSTGVPVNWTRLLPPKMVQATETDTVGDGMVIGTVSSDVLAELYRKSGKFDSQCKEAIATQSLTFQLWPDAKQGGIAMQPTEFPHVIAMCAVKVVIPTERLRRLGVKAELLDPIDAAHHRIIGHNKNARE